MLEEDKKKRYITIDIYGHHVLCVCVCVFYTMRYSNKKNFFLFFEKFKFKLNSIIIELYEFYKWFKSLYCRCVIIIHYRWWWWWWWLYNQTYQTCIYINIVKAEIFSSWMKSSFIHCLFKYDITIHLKHSIRNNDIPYIW